MSTVEIALRNDEYRLLSHGLFQWNGPASVSDPVALFVSYPSAEAMEKDLPRLSKLLDEGAMEPRDWWRVLLTTEIAFVSDMYGVGVDWSTVTPFRDDESVEILRSIQRKVAKAIGYRE
jgi:hypothetical protein